MQALSYTHAALVVAGRDTGACKPIADALEAIGVVRQRLVTRIGRADEIVSRADAEGGVPILLTTDACNRSIALLAEMIAWDALPGRAYVLVAPSDVAAALAAEDLERALPHSVDRVLVCSLEDLERATTRELLRLHLSHTCASYLGRSPRAPRVQPAPVTEMPFGERVINHIERRAMQRGMFNVAAPRVPRF